jgi:hypothetical protein
MKDAIAMAALLSGLAIHLARADECDNMANSIASKVDVLVGERTPEDFIPLSGDQFVAYLNCEGPQGMSVRLVGPPRIIGFVIGVGSILTGRTPDDVYAGIAQCLSASPPNEVHNVDVAGFKLFCKTDPDDESWEFTITQRDH